MRWSFRVFGYAILGLGTRLVRDWYAIKVLIINAVTRLHDFSLFWKGWQEKNEKKYIVGEVGKASKWCNRVPESFCGVFGGGSFCGVFGEEFLWGFWRFWGKNGQKSVVLTMVVYATIL